MGVDMGSVQTKMEVPNGGQSTPRSKPQACKVCTVLKEQFTYRNCKYLSIGTNYVLFICRLLQNCS